MPKECPQCHTMTDDRAAYCGACKYRFSEERPKRGFEDAIVPYLTAFTVAAILFVSIRHC
jgi:hypothetical protein